MSETFHNPDMEQKTQATLQDLVDHSGQFPEDAFLFVRDGLNYAITKVHGPAPEAYQRLAEHVARNNLDWGEIISRYEQGSLGEQLSELIEEAGGPVTLNRHIGGRELCWGLRDLALERWGLLALPVLKAWRIHRTLDFGRIVFTFIEYDLMQRQPGDELDDFRDVFDFEEALDQSFRTSFRTGEANC